jgi:hypothetical protein
MPIDHRVKAAKIWPHLVRAASAKSTMTSVDLAPRVGVVHRTLIKPLDVIAKHCKAQGLPPLPVVVVANDTGKPAPSSLDSDDVASAYRRVYEYDWTRVTNPFALFVTTK